MNWLITESGIHTYSFDDRTAEVWLVASPSGHAPSWTFTIFNHTTRFYEVKGWAQSLAEAKEYGEYYVSYPG